MAVLNEVTGNVRYYIQLETTNQSFIDMHYYLKRTGRVNNDFHLILFDKDLRGVDPTDENLPLYLKEKVLFECRRNYWYFIREVMRIPLEGGDVKKGARYQLNRASLAMGYLFTLNYNFYVEIPRQMGKTTAMMSRLLWIYNFATSNTSIALLHKEHKGSKDNLATLKEYRDALPSYLQMSSAVSDMTGKKLKVPNTMITIQHPLNNNKIVTFASARSKELADKMCRGMHVPLQYYDEFAFMPFNHYAYLAAMPAFSTAAKNARNNHAPYGVYITTTPGDLTTESGRFCYRMRNNATVWDECFYDYPYEKIEEVRQANTTSSMFLIHYTYQQLGRGNDYFNEMCTLCENDYAKIRREILLEWSEIAENCAFKKEDLEVIKRFCREPLYVMRLGHAGQYAFKVFEELDPRYSPIMGVDVAGAMYQDSSAITVIDSKSTKVVGTLNCNYIPSDDLADVIYVLVKSKYPNAVINIERNGGYGKTVIERLKKSSAKRNMYFEIKERVVSETVTLTGGVQKNRQLVKVFGIDSNHEIRSRLIEILHERVNYHKDKFIDKKLYDEMNGMVVKASGKTEHSNLTHDDQVFSYLMALYVWYEGKNIMENFGIMKNTIKTDENEEFMDGAIALDQDSRENVDFEVIDLEETPAYKEQMELIKKLTTKRKTRVEHDEEVFLREMEEAEMTRAWNPIERAAYNKKYHIDEDPNQQGYQMLVIPDSVFMDTDAEEDYQEKEYIRKHGNLHRQFVQMRDNNLF